METCASAVAVKASGANKITLASSAVLQSRALIPRMMNTP
jgi:hypothetical protein